MVDGAAQPYRLPPILAPAVARFVALPDRIEEVVARFGSPVNVIFPQVFADNVAAFHGVLDRAQLSYRMCYAHKANQAQAFVTTARECGIGIDVASVGELDSAIRAGFDRDRIEVTGPKGDAFLRLLLDADVVVNIDNRWELDRVRDMMAERPDRPAVPVLLRLSGFDGSAVSRFGIDLADVDDALISMVGHGSRIELRGFSFHLDSGDVGERVHALAACLPVVERAYSLGFRPRILDIGGGFRQAFSADPQQFHRYVGALRAGLNGNGKTLAWPGHTFGYRYRDGEFAGVPSFHKYGNDVAGARMLHELLDASIAGRSVAASVRDAMLELWLEPGKALLDNAGITIATVEFTKRLADGTTVVNLDIARDTITPVDQEVMLDPVISYRQPEDAYDGAHGGVFFGGHLCLERDMITRHLTFPARLPLPGDRVVFVNTAAYHMDLSASAALMHPTPPKVVATSVGGADHSGSAAPVEWFTLEADR